MNGYGMFADTDGCKSLGHFKNNKLHGKGLRIEADGALKHSVWINNVLQEQ